MNLRNCRVLVVDDYETVRLLLAKCLKELDIDQVDHAENGEEALIMLQASLKQGKTYDICFVDWNMPKVNGMELLQAMRNIEEFKSIPFVMVTANSDQQAVVSAIRAGVSDFIVKPFDTHALNNTIHKVLMRRLKHVA